VSVIGWDRRIQAALAIALASSIGLIGYTATLAGLRTPELRALRERAGRLR
jgi:hypothetical protein